MNCEHLQEIKDLKEGQQKLYESIHGNGHKGLKTVVGELCVAVEKYDESNKMLTTAISGLTKFQIETETSVRISERRDVNRKWLVALAISLGGVAVTLLGILIL